MINNIANIRQRGLSLQSAFLLLGVLMCMMSLLAPALRHGRIISVLELNFFSAFVAILGSTEGGYSAERTTFCRAMVLANICAATMPILGTRLFKPISLLGYVVFGVLLLCASFVATVPYSQIEAVYWGLFSWLTGVISIGLSGMLTITKTNDQPRARGTKRLNAD